ncbi:GNAT family N-acetyltransferase [Tropicimonas marinistellae]|uniref:GNAT family N-acetyltransferase n=1 Tax=Tropicimonas marinistellae TaxID=1739787 RepID=UPI0008338651|nr:GNAT family N-acetyltransferase [Tropicimonas marinistellae]
MSLELRALSGPALEAALDDLAALRIEVFRDFPYLYDGDLDYERRYLETYVQSGNALLVGVFDGLRLVGAATGTPMEDHEDDFAAPMARAGLALNDVYYCAESVLLPDYRGRGLGHAFFDLREAHARQLGRRYATFCAVIRPEDHPLRPTDYRPLDSFWRSRGYAPAPGVVAHFAWKDVAQAGESLKALQVWTRRL